MSWRVWNPLLMPTSAEEEIGDDTDTDTDTDDDDDDKVDHDDDGLIIDQ